MSRERRELRALKMEMLRLRGEVQRGEMAADVAQLRGGARSERGWMSAVGRIGAGVVARRGWLGLATSLLRRPWAAAAGLAALRTLKRHPVLAVSALATGAAMLGIGRAMRTQAARRQAPGEDVFSAPVG